MILANWKSRIPKDIFEYIRDVDSSLILAPPLSHLAYLSEIGYKNLAAQDVALGSLTGVISIEILNSIGIKYCIVGHAERRIHFNESRDSVYRKVETLLEANINPILCTDDEYLNKDIKLFGNLVCYAYEPLENIGKDKGISPKKIKNVIESFRDLVNAKLLYGGNVNVNNYLKLSELGLDGLLIGRASLNVKDINKILKGFNKCL